MSIETVYILLFGLVAFRATYFLSRDVLAQPIRNWLSDSGRFVLLDMVECMWCLGTWTSLVATVGFIATNDGGIAEAALYWVAVAVAIGVGGAILTKLEN